nr:MAG: hypothetical protein [Microvirus sp.]
MDDVKKTPRKHKIKASNEAFFLKHMKHPQQEQRSAGET